jgi:hypothetical protein
MISKRIENIIKYSYFEIKIKKNYIHRLLYNRLNDYIEIFHNIKVKSWHNFEEGVFAELNNMNVIGIVPTNSVSIYSSVSQPFEIKDFTFEKEHFIHKILAKKNNFDVEIGDNTYFIEFKNEDTRFKKPLNIVITRFHIYTTLLGKTKEIATLLEMKKYYRIRRRIYNNIVCINKLRDGLIRNYEVFNELELKALAKYLTNKNILFRIIEKNPSYTRKYNMLDNSYKYWLCGYRYPEENKVLKPCKLYIEVYKGYVNFTEIKDRYTNKNKYKYGIYLY